MKPHPTRSAGREPSAEARATGGAGSFTGPRRRERTAPRPASPKVLPTRPRAVRAGHEGTAGGETAGVSVSVRGSSPYDSKGSNTRERPRVVLRSPGQAKPLDDSSTSVLTLGQQARRG